jgi:ring-1,2-phenylacetyl-CoA epoxidase subunit PaaD
VVSAVSTSLDYPRPSREEVLTWLEDVMDPEVPVISIVDLGIVRNAQWETASSPAGDEDCLVVTVTPTYSGCPATEVIAESIRETMGAHQIKRLEVRTQLSPAWTTDWMTQKGRAALREYGIAPPAGAAAASGTQVINIAGLLARPLVVPCPRCESRKTRLLSQFGSTSCKALYQCHECLEPFDYFKPH